MTPREALYHLVMELGPVPQTLRDDNLTPKEVTLRDAVNTLQELVEADDAKGDYAKMHRQLNDLWKKQTAKH